MVWIQIRTDVLSVLIWVQTVYKGNQQTTTKVPASKERVNAQKPQLNLQQAEFSNYVAALRDQT